LERRCPRVNFDSKNDQPFKTEAIDTVA